VAACVAVLVGHDELALGAVTVKDMASGEQVALPVGGLDGGSAACNAALAAAVRALEPMIAAAVKQRHGHVRGGALQ